MKASAVVMSAMTAAEELPRNGSRMTMVALASVQKPDTSFLPHLGNVKYIT